jgi:flagellar biosynthetic protein FliR
MSIDLSAIVEIFQTSFAVAFGVFLRVGGAFLVLPAFGETFVPARVRLAAAFAITAILVPALGASILGQTDAAPIGASHFFSEALSGLLVGLGLRFVVHALQIAGSIAAQSTSLSQILGGASVDPQPAMGNLMMISGLTLAVLSGLHIHLIHAFLRSYEILPFGRLATPGSVGLWGVGRIAAAFSLAFSLAAPFLIASLLYNVALGVINKAMPQLMVAFVGAPAITLGGLVLLLITMPFLLPVWFTSWTAALGQPLGLP